MEELVRKTLARAQEVGSPRAVALCFHALGAVLQLSGRWLESARAFNDSIEMCRAFEGTFGVVLGEQRLAQIESAVGLFEAADSRLQGTLTMARRSKSAMIRAHSLGRIYATLALNSYESGDLEAASRYLTRGFAIQREVGECAGCDVMLYPAAVPIYVAEGKLELADQACRKAEETASAFRSRSWVATARYLAGLLARAHGDWRSAVAHLEESVNIFERLAQPYEAARSLENLAEVKATAPGAQPDEAAELIRQAAAHYREVGATYRAERAESLAAAGH